MNRYLSSSLLCLGILLAVILLTGCVTPIPLAQEAPDLSYKATRPMVVAVIDERDYLAQGKPPTYIGRVHGLFGIPGDMQTYPWFVSDKSKKKQTLAQALEERIVVGLNDEGWQLVTAGYTTRPTKDETVTLLATHNVQRLLILSITQWFASINLNWVTAFNFDWGYRFDVLDEQGIVVASIADFGRDVVDEEAKQSPQNTIKMAFRERLIKIFEQPEVKTILNKTTIIGNMYLPPSSQPVQPSSQPVQPVQPSSQPVQPSSQPVQPVQPSSQPVQPVQPSSQPVQPVQPSSQPVQPVQPSNQPVKPVQPSNQPVKPSRQPVQGNQAAKMPNYIIVPRLSRHRAVNEQDKDDCEFIAYITKNVGGVGGVSKFIKSARDSALTEAANYGADSYFIVNTESTAFGASITLEALKCK